jgi:hypothetical protein
MDEELIAALSVFVRTGRAPLDASSSGPAPWWSLVWRQLRSLSLRALRVWGATAAAAAAVAVSPRPDAPTEARKGGVVRELVRATLDHASRRDNTTSGAGAAAGGPKRGPLRERVAGMEAEEWELELSRVQADLFELGGPGGREWSAWLPFHPLGRGAPQLRLPCGWASDTFVVSDGGLRVKECGTNMAIFALPDQDDAPLPLPDLQPACVLARHPIPVDDLPAFYFEVAVREEGAHPHLLEFGLGLVRRVSSSSSSSSTSSASAFSTASSRRVVEAFVTWRATGFRATASIVPAVAVATPAAPAAPSPSLTTSGAGASSADAGSTQPATDAMDVTGAPADGDGNEEAASSDAGAGAGAGAESSEPPPRPPVVPVAAEAEGERKVTVERELFSVPFRRGDILGCGWNRADHSIFFTRDGVVVGTVPLPASFRLAAAGSSAEEEVQRGHHRGPAIHPLLRVRSKGAELVSNFGQFPFLFDFHTHLRHQLLQLLPTPPSASPILRHLLRAALHAPSAPASASPRTAQLPPPPPLTSAALILGVLGVVGGGSSGHDHRMARPQGGVAAAAGGGVGGRAGAGAGHGAAVDRLDRHRPALPTRRDARPGRPTSLPCVPLSAAAAAAAADVS